MRWNEPLPMMIDDQSRQRRSVVKLFISFKLHMDSIQIVPPPANRYHREAVMNESASAISSIWEYHDVLYQLQRRVVGSKELEHAIRTDGDW
jgi:hypothetical protein